MQDLRSTVLSRISDRSSTSDSRRKYLERLGTLTAGSKIRVKFSSVPTASCGWREGGKYHQINISQFVENFSYKNLKSIHQSLGTGTCTALMQEGFLYHELGHVLMSDYDAWESVVNSINSLQAREKFKVFLNATEDVVIEVWLRQKFNCGTILDFKNQAKAHCMSPQTPTNERNARSHHATYSDDFTDLLELITAVGRYDHHFINYFEYNYPDEYVEDKMGFVTEMLSEVIRIPNAEERYEKILSYFIQMDVAQMAGNNDNLNNKDYGSENEGAGEQMVIEMPAPPESQSGDDGNEGDESGEGSSAPNREARSVSEILGDRSPDEVKVVK